MNIVAVLGGALVMVNIGWPRVEVYDPPPGHPHWYLQYLSLLFVALSVGIGAIA